MSTTTNYETMKKAADFKKQRQAYVQYYINKYYDLYRGM